MRLYPYAPCPDRGRPARRHPVVVVGAGPVGLILALDLGRRGTPVLLLDEGEGPGEGSRAICFSKRTLEIADRLGVGQAMVDKGVQWSRGRVFHGPHEVFAFDLMPEAGHRRPAFINLQQPYFEAFLIDGIRNAQRAGAPIEIRGGHRVTGLTRHAGHSLLEVETPDGPYRLEADWLVACDGARSPLRGMLGLGFEGRVFHDNFLIADVRMRAPFPTERWFWFDPPFPGAGQSALLHRQPDDIWRMDFQLGPDIDREAEKAPERVRPRIEGMLGPGVDYSVEWVSIYTFQCRRMRRFRHDRVLFAGDAAHQVSPFGARGANSGVQDADNLGWKLDLVVRGAAPEWLLDSYDAERAAAADENILQSTRATDFLTPKSEISRIFREAVLGLARDHAFARPLINSGRLSVPSVYDTGPLNGPDDAILPARSRPGAPCADAPLGAGFLLDRLGDGFTLLALNAAPDPPAGLPLRLLRLDTAQDDPTGALAERYLGAAPAALYLIRPDRHVVARWTSADARAVARAHAKALAAGV
jgi:3-(3-hydroxy-phenyl)propionate hydroxylase